jgi:hypothetical protein
MNENIASRRKRLMGVHSDVNNLVVGALNGYGVMEPSELKFSDDLEKALVDCLTAVHSVLRESGLAVCSRCLNPRFISEAACRWCSMPAVKDV